MPRFFLLFSKPHGGFAPIVVTCASVENTDKLWGIHREFERIHDLKSALEAAGISEYESKAPLMAVSSGFCSFMPVPLDAAVKLGLLDRPHSHSDWKEPNK
jgi:hypothetical protein